MTDEYTVSISNIKFLVNSWMYSPMFSRVVSLALGNCMFYAKCVFHRWFCTIPWWKGPLIYKCCVLFLSSKGHLYPSFVFYSILQQTIYIQVLCSIPFGKRPFIYRCCVLFFFAKGHLYTVLCSIPFLQQTIYIQVLCPIPFGKRPFIYRCCVLFFFAKGHLYTVLCSIPFLQQTIYIQVLCSIPFCKRLLIYKCCVPFLSAKGHLYTMTMKSNLLPWFTASVVSIKYIWIIQDTDNYKHTHFHKVQRNHTGYIHIHVNIYTWQTAQEALAYVLWYRCWVLFLSAKGHLYTSVVFYSFLQKVIYVLVLCSIPFCKRSFIY